MTKRIHQKLALSLRVARECSRASWQEPKKDRKEYKRISREAMRDAREWSALLQAIRKGDAS